ncbi:auxin efflux carrier superfamily [Histoplasma ohiense]|nr:auxin efflux carrier superfamily [Histoplasma ohiense (nom. inval.)]
MLFTSPTSFVNAHILHNSSHSSHSSSSSSSSISALNQHVAQQHLAAAAAGWPSHSSLLLNTAASPQAAQPPLPRLVILVLSAVLEIVCISLPGYILARMGRFDAEAQKFVANLNVALFTPCLVFTKLASQLTAEKLTDLAIIPCIFAVQTAVSYLCASVVSRLFRFNNPQSNFVVAMGVFGNSNSLPISLVLSLAHTLEGLRWDRIPNDNSQEVAARGILYLLIFQQLGQLLRWSWGYRVLLAPPESYHRDEEEIAAARICSSERYTDEPDNATTPAYSQTLIDTTDNDNVEHAVPSGSSSFADISHFESGGVTPITTRQYSYSKLVAMDDSGEVDAEHEAEDQPPPLLQLPIPNCQFVPSQFSTHQMPEPQPQLEEQLPTPPSWRYPLHKLGHHVKFTSRTLATALHTRSKALFHRLPLPVQKLICTISHNLARFLCGLWSFMNPPLWAMLAAIIVASIPSLQLVFFNPSTFINNSVTRAIQQSGNVAVPLILVVLGANLARNTLPDPTTTITCSEPDLYQREERNLIVASLLARMLLPMLIMGPLLALAVKFISVSILDDPIFVVVCFLLAGAPSALQLAQICQLNNVYMGAMARLLFQSYVVWILPSTLLLVILALKVVQWATAA